MPDHPVSLEARAPGVRVLPLRTPTLPPATHTNTVFVGRARVWIVDPATPHDAERARLARAVEAVRADGAEIGGIVLTHHHRDHVGGAAWLAEQAGLPILAHPRTGALLDDVTIARTLDEGDVLLGGDGDDDRWHILHTPGHASDHVVLWEPVRRTLIAGDMVAGVGTIVIVPPDGHMATYIAQLERLAALRPARLVPAHGEVTGDPVALLEHYVAHRLAREARVLDALDPNPSPLLDVTRRAYTDVPPSLHLLASRSALAHLEKLRDEGRARKSLGADDPDGLWSRA